MFGLLVGCAAIKPTAKPNFDLSYRDLLERNVQWQKSINSLSGNTRITLDTPQYSGNFSAEVSLSGQDSLMITVNGPLGIDVGKVFIAENRFIFYNQVMNQFYTGMREDFANRNFLQFPLKISQLREVFVAQDKFDILKRDLFEIRDDQYYIEATNAHYSYKIWFDPVYFLIKRIEYLFDGQVEYYKEYDQFREINGTVFPMAINFVRPGEKQGVYLYFSDLELNVPIDEQDFQIKVSDSARQIDLSLQN